MTLKITDHITVTELSRRTKKTRPTIYKYINEYYLRNYDDIPYSIKVLFDMISASSTTKEEIKEYCLKKFGNSDIENEKIEEIVQLLNENYQKLDLEEIKNYIKEKIETYGKK